MCGLKLKGTIRDLMGASATRVTVWRAEFPQPRAQGRARAGRSNGSRQRNNDPAKLVSGPTTHQNTKSTLDLEPLSP